MLSQQDLEQCQQILQQYRVNELHLLLGYFKAPKLGKKHELLQRCHSFLQNPRYQREFAQKIREINNSAGSQPRYSAYPQQQAYASRPSSGPSYGGGNMTGWAANQAQQQGGYRANDGQLQSMLGNPFALPGTSAFASSGGSTYRVKNLKPVKLPFFDLKDVVLELKELPGTANGMQQPSARLQFEFNVNPCILEGLVRNEGLPLPRRELQMRFFSADGNNTEQPDAFPPHCSVRIDGQAVVLPNVIPTNKPNVEPKRPSRPVNVTAYVSPHLNKHTISVEWSSDKRFWGVGIYHVERLSSTILHNRLMHDPRYLRPLHITKNTIVQRLNRGDDDGISMDSMKISLLCPLGRTRMTMPAKGAECTHLQCFDLDMYLRMNEKRPTWKCAICDKVSTAYKLIIDQYFLDILQRAELSVSDVELLKDGSWRVIKVEAETLSSDDEDIVPCKITSSSTDPTRSSTITSNPSSSSASMLPADDDIIVLDSDDDIDVTPPPPPSASTTQTSDSDRNGTPVLLSPQNVSERSDISIICLDDSDGDVMPIPDTSSPASQMSNMLQMPTESSSVSLGEVSQALSNGHASSAGTPQTLMAALAPLMTQTSNPSTSNHMTSPMFAQSPYGALQPSVPTSFPWTGGAYNGMATSAVVPQVSQGFVQYDYNSFLNGNGRTNLNFDPVAQRNIQDTVAQLLGTISNNTQQSYYDRTS